MTTLCTTPNCQQKANMKCPKCLELGINDSYFCSQDCFKGYYKEHKAVHDMVNKIVKAKRGFTENSEVMWPGYGFTGVLRPYQQSPYRPIPTGIERPDYADSGMPESERKVRGNTSITSLTIEDQEKMRTTCRIAREVLDEAVKVAKVGVTTDEIDRIVHEACIKRKCYPSPLNYYNFPKSCCTSVNEVICHGIPDSRPLKDGDILNIDITVYYNGFHGDLNETIYIGKVSDENKILVNTAYECLAKAMEMIKPGTRYRDVGDVISKHSANNNCSVVRTYCGHGIHRLFHCAPNVPHYSKNKAVGIMKPGHCFTIEPMINAGMWRDQTWPDNWTAVTVDGRCSAQFEHTFLVTETGYEVLTARPFDNEQDKLKYPGGKPHFKDQEEHETNSSGDQDKSQSKQNDSSSEQKSDEKQE